MTTDAVPVCRFGDAPLTIEDVVALAQRQCEAALSDAPAFRAPIQRGADFLDRLLREDGAEVVEGFETRVWVGRHPDKPDGIKAQPIPEDLIARFRDPPGAP